MADGLLGIDPGTLSQLQALMGQLGPSEQEKRAARAQAAILAGLGMIATPKGREWQTLPRAAAAGVMDYNQQLRDLGDDRLKRLSLAQALGKYQQGQQQMAAQAQQQQRMRGIFAADGATQPGPPQGFQTPGGAAGAFNAELGGAAPARPLPTQVAGQGGPNAEQFRKAAVAAAEIGDSESAKRYADIANALEPEYSTTPVQFRTPEGIKSSLISKRGTTKDLPHTVAEKAHFLDTGGKVAAVDPYTGNLPAGSAIWEKAATPGDVLSANVSMRGQNMTDARARDANAIAQGNRAQGQIEGLRKEVNALDDVKNFRAAVPMLNSAKQAPNTPAGDLDVIYAVGKALDPNSVVREGELNLVIRSGSLPQRIVGYANYVMGGGRLAPPQRAELMAMLTNRVTQLKRAHDAATAPYRKQAQERGLPEDEVFIETPTDLSFASGRAAGGNIGGGYRVTRIK